MEVRPVSLRESLGAVSFVSTGDIIGSRFCSDSRRVQPGDVFVALRGSQCDGHLHIDAAIARGAACVIVERPSSRISVPQCIVANSRAAFARICMDRLGAPQRLLNISGVTGTNGKTTTTWLLRSILESAGRKTGLLGTLEYFDGRTSKPASLTTPDCEQIAQLLSQMAVNHVGDCVLEISSHALDQDRCAGITLSSAAITNITQDHFDYHGDIDHYRAAKARIASLLGSGCPLFLGVDDAGCQSLRDRLKENHPVVTFGLDPTADVRVEILQASPSEQTLRLCLQNATVEIKTPLIGRHNALNVLAAATMAEHSGVAANDIHAGLERVLSVPGRMERVDVGQPFFVFVDYAHTPDGIAHCVSTARKLTSGHVILAFGAGGDRDRSKRPLMAQAAGGADAVIVTSDNPRSESPQRIIAEIVAGFDSLERIQTCVDRQQGIRAALRLAQPRDVVVIAGRGHEKIQQIGERRISFDDRRVTRRLLLELQIHSGAQSDVLQHSIPA